MVVAILEACIQQGHAHRAMQIGRQFTMDSCTVQQSKHVHAQQTKGKGRQGFAFLTGQAAKFGIWGLHNKTAVEQLWGGIFEDSETMQAT